VDIVPRALVVLVKLQCERCTTSSC